MTLSTQVETALNEAQDKLREALAFAARSEKPYISKHISDMITVQKHGTFVTCFASLIDLSPQSCFSRTRHPN